MKEVIQVLHELNIWSVLFRITLAALLGALIGLERTKHGRDAGTRTHALVCMSAAITVMVGLYSTVLLDLGGDPMRISAQVVSGIGFLCAGTIITWNQSHITGLTTAAGLWATAAIGLAVGIGFYSGALIGFSAMEIIVVLFHHKKYMAQTHSFYLELEDVDGVNAFWEAIRPLNVSTQMMPPQSGQSGHVGICVSITARESGEDILKQLRQMDQVVFVRPQ